MRDAREELRRAQAAVLDHLLAGAVAPPAFSEESLAVARESLMNKRMRGVARCLPRLADALGAALAERFASYAAKRPSVPQGGPAADAWGFARDLRAQGLFPAAARPELASFALQFSFRGGLVRRRRLAIRFARLGAPRRIALGVKLPRSAPRWFVVPSLRPRLTGSAKR